MNLFFTNPGEIDIRGATVAGLSAKADQRTAIGFFGTGLKYAIASVLRMGGSITIYSGLDEYIFYTEDLDFRGREFKQIVMDCRGKATPLGFTTEYGKTWQPWQIFRELLANARDEQGDVFLGASPAPGQTLIHVNCRTLRESYLQRDTIILPTDHTPHYPTPSISIASLSPSSYLYYKGVRVREDKYLHTYNIHRETQLTEDRTIASTYEVEDAILDFYLSCTDESLILSFLTATNDYAEGCIGIGSYSNPGPVFLAVAERLWKQDPRKHKRLSALMHKHRPELVEPAIVPISRVQQAMLDRALSLVTRMGMDPTAHDISVRNLGDSTLGQYVRSTGKVFLSPELFNQGTKQLLSTLYEELLHATTGKADCTYNMQTFLFNQIVSLYEEHVFGEPI